MICLFCWIATCRVNVLARLRSCTQFLSMTFSQILVLRIILHEKRRSIFCFMCTSTLRLRVYLVNLFFLTHFIFNNFKSFHVHDSLTFFAFILLHHHIHNWHSSNRTFQSTFHKPSTQPSFKWTCQFRSFTQSMLKDNNVMALTISTDYFTNITFHRTLIK